MSDENELDHLLMRLRDAENAGEAPEILKDLRHRISIASDKEAQAREAKWAAEELVARGPGFTRGDGESEPPVLFLPEQREELPLGASRFGGLPDLPAGWTWPTHAGKKLPFLAQIDFESLPRGSRLLPAEGWLLAFGLLDGDQDYRSYPLSVQLHIGPRSQLHRATCPQDSEIWHSEFESPVYDLVALTLRSEEDLKPIADYGEKNCCGWLFGEVDEFWGSAGSLAHDAWHSGDDWINLLAIDSVGSMQWSDCGHLYLLARRRDLAAGDLTKVIASVCST